MPKYLKKSKKKKNLKLKKKFLMMIKKNYEYK